MPLWQRHFVTRQIKWTRNESEYSWFSSRFVQQCNHSENDWSPVVRYMKLVRESGYAGADSHSVETCWLEYVICSYAFKNKTGNIRNIWLIQYNERHKKSYCGLNCSQDTMGEAVWKLHERVIFRNTILLSGSTKCKWKALTIYKFEYDEIFLLYCHI